MYIQLNMEDTEALRSWRLCAQRLAAEGSQEGCETLPGYRSAGEIPKADCAGAGAFLSVQVSFYILIGFILLTAAIQRCGNESR